MPIDLAARAYEAMVEAGFQPMPSAATLAEAQVARPQPGLATAPPHDLRDLLWSSIDNPESRDLDQVEVAERLPDNSIRLLIGIADVDAFVPAGSLTDQHAANNTTSVYTGITTFPMLPAELSEDRTSLLPNVDRLAIIIDLTVASDGMLSATSLKRAWIRNQARLDYETVATWLEAAAPLPPSIAGIAGLAEQIQLQDEVAARLFGIRQRNGALDFETIEARPVIAGNQVVDLTVPRKNRARYIIENMMIGVNTAMASFLMRHQMPVIQRVVRTPERWSRIVALAAEAGDPLPAAPDAQALAGFLTRRRAADPAHFPDLSLAIVKLLGAGDYTVVLPGAHEQGHFGLAVAQYTHSTAPNRRYADLITQRLVKAVLDNQPPPYTNEQLSGLAERCNERASAARGVERQMRKFAAVMLLAPQIGQEFSAIVTGVSRKGSFVRLLAPPAEGRLVSGETGVDVGDQVQVRLISVNSERGFIDFERLDQPAPTA